jgi:hypothetical protein
MFAIFARMVVNACIKCDDAAMLELSYLQGITSSLESSQPLCRCVRGTRFGRGGSSSADDSGPLTVESVNSIIHRPSSVVLALYHNHNHALQGKTHKIHERWDVAS